MLLKELERPGTGIVLERPMPPPSPLIDSDLADRIVEEQRRKLREGEHIEYYGLDPGIYDALVSTQLTSFTWLDKPPMLPQGWDFLCRALRCSSKLITVNLSGTKLDLPAFLTLCSALECLHSLVTLDLSDTGLADDHMRRLGQVLRIRTTLEHLQVPFNSIGPHGMYHLARAVPHLTALRTLDVSYNPIGDDGLRCLRRSLDILAAYGEIEEGTPRRSPLERLYLNATRLEPAVAGPILIEMLRSMPSLTKVHVPGNEFHSSQESFFISEAAREEGVEVELYMAGSGWQGETSREYEPPGLTPEQRKWLEDREPDPESEDDHPEES